MLLPPPDRWAQQNHRENLRIRLFYNNSVATAHIYTMYTVHMDLNISFSCIGNKEWEKQKHYK